MSLKIYQIVRELVPFTEKSVVSEFYRNCSIIYNKNKVDVRIAIPKYGFISARKNVLREVIRLKDIPVKHVKEEIHASAKSSFIPDSKVQTYFLVNPEMFQKIDSVGIVKKSSLKSYKSKYLDSFMYFSIASLNTLKYLYWKPDRIISNDWQSAIIPILMNNKYYDDGWFKGTKFVLILSSDQEFHSYSKKILDNFMIPNCEYDLSDPVEYLKAAITYADGVTFLKVKGKDKFKELFKNKDISKLLKEKGDAFKEMVLEAEQDEDLLEQTAKEYYTYLEKI